MWLTLLVSAAFADDHAFDFGEIDVADDICVEHENTPWLQCDLEVEIPLTLRRDVGPTPRDCGFFILPPCNGEEGDWLIRSLPVMPGETIAGVAYSLLHGDPTGGSAPPPFDCDVTIPHQVMLWAERPDTVNPLVVVDYDIIGLWTVNAAAPSVPDTQVDLQQRLPATLPIGSPPSYVVGATDRIMMAVQVAGATDGPPLCDGGGIEGGAAICPVANQCPEVPVTSSWSRDDVHPLVVGGGPPFDDRESLATVTGSELNAQFGVLLLP